VARSLFRRGVLGLICALALVLAQAQQATFSTGVNVVNVLVTVRNRQGELVQGLSKDDFTLEDDGRPQKIQYFSPRTDQPLTIGLLVDVSGSQRTVIAEERRATRRFFDQVVRGLHDHAFIVLFDRRVQFLQDLTLPDVDTRKNQAQGTSLYDAVAVASRSVAGETGRKALIVLSDGYDTSSSATLNMAIEAAQRADTLVYSIRFLDRDIFAFEVPASQGGSPVPRAGRKALEQLARETGGAYFDLTATESLEKIYTRIEDELRNQYYLGFTPGPGREKARSGYRKLRVSVKRKGLTVHARDGYYPAE